MSDVAQRPARSRTAPPSAGPSRAAPPPRESRRQTTPAPPADGPIDARAVRRVLLTAARFGARDIHFKVGAPPMFRVQDELKETPLKKLTAEDTEWIGKHLLIGTEHDGKPIRYEMEASYSLPEVARFRMSVFRQRGAVSVVMRLVPLEVPSFEGGLGLPRPIERISELKRGLVLIAGTAGSGKSTTLAAIIHRMNQTRRDHIVTIEDPIEFLHNDIRCSITQREVGSDSHSFSDALRASLRQDPDVILVGELRDRETIEIALRAAETGHLVLSTIHTPDSAEAINRVLGVFPGDQQAAVRYQLADSLKAVVAQRLVPRKDGEGMVMAAEILFSGLTVQEYIRSGRRLDEIRSILEKQSDATGCQTFDQHLRNLYQSGLISREAAVASATTPGDFERALHFD